MMNPPRHVLGSRVSRRGVDGANVGGCGAVMDSAHAASQEVATTSANVANRRRDMEASRRDVPPGIGRRLSQMLGTMVPRLNGDPSR
jgi:hypothetical protein